MIYQIKNYIIKQEDYLDLIKNQLNNYKEETALITTLKQVLILIDPN